MEQHILEKQLNYLKEALSSDKRPIGVFLAAGCPLSIQIDNEPLIPDVATLTDIICKELSQQDNSILCSICREVAKTQNEIPNIEHILSYIRSLKLVVGKNNFLSMNIKMIEELENEICNKIADLVNKKLTEKTTPYHKLALWASAITRVEPLTIFTTNYDLLLEQAFEEIGVPYFDGFIGSRKAFFDPYSMEEDKLPARWVRFWKLHGSINWHQDGNSKVWRGKSGDSKMLIYPSHLKYEQSRRMPYLAMMDQLRAFLKIPQSVLIICGYSFNDEHINEVLLQGLRGNPRAMVFTLLYGKLKEYPKAIELAIQKYNISLLAHDEAIIGGRKGTWGQLNSKTEDGTNKETEFCLGDFKQFAEFIESAIYVSNLVDSCQEKRGNNE